MTSLIAQLDLSQLQNAIPNLSARFKFINIPARGAAVEVGPIITDIVVPWVFLIAGILLLFLLILGGYALFLSTGNEEKIKKAQGQVTNALLGFLMLFISYWVVQIVEAVLGITIF